MSWCRICHLHIVKSSKDVPIFEFVFFLMITFTTVFVTLEDAH